VFCTCNNDLFKMHDDWAGDKFFCHGQKRDCLSRASQRARGATKNVSHCQIWHSKQLFYSTKQQK